MTEQLPYELTKGVTATREGLILDQHKCPRWFKSVFGTNRSASGITTISWPVVSERLRYREGEPWCGIPFPSDKTDIIVSYPAKNPARVIALHRLVTILCDDAEAFRVLHWCVENLKGDSDET